MSHAGNFAQYTSLASVSSRSSWKDKHRGLTKMFMTKTAEEVETDEAELVAVRSKSKSVDKESKD